jgi:peptidoglycan/LPS O-acetylase OafA/YrhL
VTRARVTDSHAGDQLAGRPDLPSVREPTIQPAFDGLRGVAVLGVLAAHLGVFLAPGLTPWPLKGGFLGVDLFFVLSGFLITGLLVKELERSRRIRLKRFYVRRVTRLVPALLGLLVAHWVYVAIEGYYSFDHEREAIIYALTFTTNWQTTWGVRPAIDVPLDLSHLWSLGIEGQFYLVWPLVLWGLFRWLGAGRKLIAVLAAAIAAVALVRVLEFHWYNGTTEVYTRFDTRADALLVGALLAVVCVRDLLPSPNVRLWLAAAGAAGLAVAVALTTPSTTFLYWGGFTAVAIAGAAILSATLERTGRLARALSWSPIRCIGLASYSIYLWHLPVYFWAVRVVPGGGFPRIALALTVTALTSTVSYLLLERPYMRSRGRLVGPSPVPLTPALAEAPAVP